MLRSLRTTPEDRLELMNENLRIDFDPRTSDTMYNYLWVRRPGKGPWERVHNFGVDVRSYLTTDSANVANLIGMNLELERKSGAMRVVYPQPLIQYRHFDDKVGSLAMANKYPDVPLGQVAALPHADGSLEFTYSIDPSRPSFVVSGKVLSGRIVNVVYILSALWTDNHALPTHQYVEGFPEWDLRDPQTNHLRDIEVEKVGYVIFYRHDGNGVPFALLPQQPLKAGVCNYFDNWRCLYDFGQASINQAYVPEAPAVEGSNDTGYTVTPREGGELPGVRVAFFPELGWLAGGRAHDLRARIIAAVETQYADAMKSWDRFGKWVPRRLIASSYLMTK